MTRALVICGASARSAAFSALRAGFQTFCADLFADRDLQQWSRSLKIPISDYPQAIPDLIHELPDGPCLLTGSMENYPQVVRSIEKHRPIQGSSAEVMQTVRCPFTIYDWLIEENLPSPLARCEVENPGTSWIRKPLQVEGTHFFQEWIEGISCSAVYLEGQFLGASEQLIGESWLHARPFQYCGSVGPLSLSASTRETLIRIGRLLADRGSMRGYFGIDFILRDDMPFLIEVNPRYTASIEIIERGQREERLFSKAILFARESICFPDQGPWLSSLEKSPLEAWPDFADIPHPGEIISQGWPVLTFFAEAQTVMEHKARLRSMASSLDRLLLGE